jgi:hypothetical protein
MLDAVARLADGPRPAGSFPYGSPDRRRLRVGRYRVMYRDDGCMHRFADVIKGVRAIQLALASPDISNVYTGKLWWGSNPRPADYENYGPALPTLYLRGYHGAVPLMALIALYARVARSTNRSTTTTVSA